MKKSGVFSAILLSAALVAVPFAPATAAVTHTAAVVHTTVASKAPKVVTYKNCTALQKKYKGGVAKAGVKYNKVSGKNKAFKVKPYSSTALYNANKKLDRDKDGIACEKG